MIKKSLKKNKKCQKSSRKFFIRNETHSGRRSSDRGRSELFRVPHICGPLFPRCFWFPVVLAEPLPNAPGTSPEAFQRECMANSLYVKAHNSRECDFFHRSCDLVFPFLLSSLLIVFLLVLKLSDLFFPLNFSYACGKNKCVSMALSML